MGATELPCAGRRGEAGPRPLPSLSTYGARLRVEAELRHPGRAGLGEGRKEEGKGGKGVCLGFWQLRGRLTD